MEEELETFKELIELIPLILKTSKECVNRDLITFNHDLERIKTERKMLKDIMSIIQGKWTIDIIYCVRIMGEAHYNELKNVLIGISSRVLADRLKMLVKRKIIARRMHDTQPIGVSYKLTKFGENLFYLMVPILIYSLSWRGI
ncbi:MAG: winged helix-turn-helix transcriptional regulator [Promethearchaeota archaeon]